MWYVYLILCRDKSIYIGATSDINQRYLDHKTGKGGKFTKDRKVEKLLYFEKYTNKHEALKREKQIKGWRREKKINLIKFGIPVRKLVFREENLGKLKNIPR